MSVLPADTFIVVNKTALSDKDRNILILLYQPIVGGQAISLYYTLWSYLDKSELLSSLFLSSSLKVPVSFDSCLDLIFVEFVLVVGSLLF